MKNAAILHGTGGSPDSYWHPWLKNNLEANGYNVWLPQLPNPKDPKLEECLPFVLNGHNFDEETVLIGHSSGCPLILAALESLNIKIKQAILVGGYAEELKGGLNPMIKKVYDWEKIKNNVNDIIFINADDDPWGCDDKVGRNMFDKLGGTLIIPHGQGHMGSTSFNQPYREFPLLLKLID